jgi:glycosyltransferase involved in cell wall biosynthesis
LQNLADDRALLRRVSSAAAEAAKEWTWENSAKDFMAHLERLATA